MTARRNPFVAREGITWLLLVAIGSGVVWRYASPGYLVIPSVLFIYLFMVFRDPRRNIPAVPLGLVSPVADGSAVAGGLCSRRRRL